MQTQHEEYTISFFKPTTPEAKKRRDLTIVLVIIWATAIFGFQILLRIMEEPTPEQAYLDFESSWEQLKTGNNNNTSKQKFCKSLLSVLGKVTLKPDDKVVLSKAFSSVSYELLVGQDLEKLKKSNKRLISLKKQIKSLNNEEYVALKRSITTMLALRINIPEHSLKAKLIPLVLTPEGTQGLSNADKDKLPLVMKKYLIHNQSAITNFKFLGFPFHYFYTAVFLLILFISLCWIYCYRIDKMEETLAMESGN